jgi:molecular chaperone GrpE
MLKKKIEFNKRVKKEKKKDKVKELEEKLEEAMNGWKRALADYENYKKRSDEDKKELVQYATENFILEILPVLDNFQSAYKTLPKELEGNAWAEGIRYIKDQLETVLKNNGTEELKTIGEKFDPRIHEAIAKVKSEDEKDIIVEEVVKGYRMREKVIRAAKVKIGY